MKCRDCKFWDQHESKSFTNIGTCLKAKMFWNSTEWNDDCGREEIDPSNLMYVQDSSDYFAALYTKENFFCAHFDPK